MTPSTVVAFGRNNTQWRGVDLVRVMDSLRDESAAELQNAIAGASIKRIKAAAVPGISAFGLSRSVNGDSSNVLYRIASLYMLLKKLGFPRARVQRLIDWQQAILNWLYGPAEDDEAERKNEGREG